MRRFGDVSSPPRDYYGGYPPPQQNEGTRAAAPSLSELLSMSASSDRSTGMNPELLRLLTQQVQQQQVQQHQPDMTSLLLLQLQQQQQQQQYAPQAQQGLSSTSDFEAALKQHDDQSMLSRLMAQQRQTQLSSTTDYDAAAALRKRQEDQLLVSRVMAQQRQLDDLPGRGDLNESPLEQQQRKQLSLLHQHPSSFNNTSPTADSMIQGQGQRVPPSGQGEIPGRGQLLPRVNAGTGTALNTKVPGYLEAKVGDETDVSLNKSSGKSEAEDASEEEVEEEEEDAGREEDPNNDTFPHKLYRMVAEAEEEGNDNIVSFFPHGKAFAIHKPHEFVREIMPKYFTTSRMSSFQRQLNLYGFRRITEGQDKGGYFHDSFLKGRKSLIKKIKRKKTSVRAPPNFFAQSLANTGQPPLTSREILAAGNHNLQGLQGLQGLLGPSAAPGVDGTGGDVNQALLFLMKQQQVQQQQQTDLMQQLLFRQQQGPQRYG
jgi:hypothetical protein